MTLKEKSTEERIEELRHAVGMAMLSWGDIENSLVNWLQSLLDPKTLDHTIATAIYFAPNNTETRLAIIHAVAMEVLIRVPYSFHNEVIACWRKVLSRINKAKETRNKIAHWHIAHYHQHGKEHIRLTASIHDGARFKKETPGQLPGMSAHDVRAAAELFGNLSGQVSTLMFAVKDWRNEPPKFPASREKFLVLANHLKIEFPSITDQTP